MKDILDQMEEHIAEIRNLQRNFDYHSKRLEALMRKLSEMETNQRANQSSVTVDSSDLQMT